MVLIAIAAGLVLTSGGKSSKAKSGSSHSSGPRPKECNALSASGGHLAGIDYIEIVTAGASTSDRLPMIVSLHGLGYDFNAHVKWLEQLKTPARVILPNALFTQSSSESKRAWWPSYSNKALQNASKSLAQFVYLIQQCRPTTGKPVITGHSQGGYVAIDFATQFPELISASVPVAGARNGLLWDIVPRVPMYPVHGTLDSSYESAFKYYNEMSSRGLPVYLTAVEGGAHRISTKNAEAWRYVLEHLIS